MAAMMSNGPIIPPGTVLPPMLTPAEAAKQAARQQAKTPGRGKAKQRGKTGDRFGVLNQFVDAAMAELTRAELATWLVLYRDTRNGSARTSASDIARRGGTSRRSVQDALVSLKKHGLIFPVYKGGLGRGLSIYRVNGG